MLESRVADVRSERDAGPEQGEVRLTFPSASNGPSKKRMVPRKRKNRPKDVMPTPIFCASVLHWHARVSRAALGRVCQSARKRLTATSCQGRCFDRGRSREESVFRLRKRPPSASGKWLVQKHKYGCC